MSAIEVDRLPRTVRWQGDPIPTQVRNICNDLDDHENRFAQVITKVDGLTKALLALATSVIVAAVGIIGTLLATRGGH